MSWFDFISRLITAAALVALAVTVGVWLTRAPLTAALTILPPVNITPEPILASPPTSPTVAPTTIEVPVEMEIAAPIAVAPEPPAAKPVEPKNQPRPTVQPRRRGILGRWR